MMIFISLNEKIRNQLLSNVPRPPSCARFHLQQTAHERPLHLFQSSWINNLVLKRRIQRCRSKVLPCMALSCLNIRHRHYHLLQILRTWCETDRHQQKILPCIQVKTKLLRYVILSQQGGFGAYDNILQRFEGE